MNDSLNFRNPYLMLGAQSLQNLGLNEGLHSF